MLVGVVEGMLPFKLEDRTAATTNGLVRKDEALSEDGAIRLQEERRLMYVGITRAKASLAVSWTRKRKKGRDLIAAQPSRFIAEMALDQNTVKADPRARLRALRAEFAQKALN
jgi:ATP-dependent DNA helicase Rep